jgi:DNA repair protein RecO (recombination protein O)
MQEVTCEAVVCGVVPYADDDAVVRLLTATHGRVGAFARKARASRRRFPGLVAPALGVARMVPRRAADLWELKELEIEACVLALGEDPRRLGYAAYLCELVERLLPEAEPTPAIHALVRDVVRSVAHHGAQPVILRAAELQLLGHLGYLPELVLQDEPTAECVAYDPHAGRLLARATAGSVPFSAGALEAARGLLAAERLDALPAVPTETLRVVSRIFAEHLRRHLGSPLRSVAFLRSLEGVEGPAASR